MTIHCNSSNALRGLMAPALLLLAGIASLSIPTAHGTNLIFTKDDGSGFGDYATLPQGYGNRVVQATQDGFGYGLDGGATPNIVTVFNQSGMPLVRTWDGGAGNLPHFVTTGGDTGADGLFEFDLVADAGYMVYLNSFDMANWGNYSQTITSLTIEDGDGNVLFRKKNVLVPGTLHTHYTFPGVKAPVIKIKFDASVGVDADDVSIDNINFSQSAGVSDFNGDRNPDYVLVKPDTQETAIWTLKGLKVKDTTAGPTVTLGYELVAVADVDGDGHPDYVLYNPSTRQIAVWYLAGATVTNVAVGLKLPAGWSLVALADFDGDGQLDYLLFNSSTRRTQVWYMDGLAKSSSANGPRLPAGWSLVGTGDFNGDLNPDYVLFNSSSRQTAVWYMDGVTHTGGANVRKVPAGWALQGVADFDDNGQSDFVVVNPATGETAVWYLDGVTFLNSRNGPTLTTGFDLASP